MTVRQAQRPDEERDRALTLQDRLETLRAAVFDHGRRRIVAAAFGAFVVLEVIAFLIAQLLVGGNPARDPALAVSRLAPAGIDGIVAAPDAQPEKLETPRAMGSQFAGVAVVAVSDVDSVTTPSGARRAPVGGRLLAFRLGDGVCEVEPCKSWRTLAPQVTIDGATQELPDGADTFVVTLSPGRHTVDLSIEADGFGQSLSLLDDFVGRENIRLLGSEGLTKRTVLKKTFEVVEKTSVPLQYPDGRQIDTFNRTYTVEYVQRRFFFNGTTPESPTRVFLIVNAYYSYAGQTQKYVAPVEASFVDKRGVTYEARDLDPDESVALLGFEIGADIKSGTFRIGGSIEKAAANGVPYTSTLSGFELDIDLS